MDWTYDLMEELESAADSALRPLVAGKIREIPRAALVEMDRIMAIRNLPRCGARCGSVP